MNLGADRKFLCADAAFYGSVNVYDQYLCTESTRSNANMRIDKSSKL